jgi:hypothetical protein
MQKLYFIICLAVFGLTLPTGAAAAEDYITLSLPESVIAKAVQALLPLNIDAHSGSIEGDITIINISSLQLSDDHLSCLLHLAGNNLAFLTEIAGHEIRLKVGSVEVEFKTRAALRFDSKKQTLFVKPMVENLKGKDSGSNADIGQALVSLLNGREFPVNLQKLDPLIARTGTKTVTINNRIADIKVAPKLITLQLTPQISAQ